MRILLSDGSGLTARQTAAQLAAAGHEVEVLVPSGLVLTRFTRHVHRLHRVPAYGPDPLRWLEATVKLLRLRRFDALLATQEQMAVLAAHPERVRACGVGLAVPPFAALRRVQDKLSQVAALARLRLPQPETVVAATREELLAVGPPVFVKAPIGTASLGVRRVRTAGELARVADELERSGGFAQGGVVAQRPVEGPLAMVQAVYAEGRLLASHACVRTREGANGGASGKVSIDLPTVRTHLALLGGALGWHGPLALDAILAEEGPRYVDVNPRLVEPGNAWRAGVDLVDVLLRVSLGEEPEPAEAGREGVATHQLLLALLAAAQEGRAAIVRELRDAAAGAGPYAGSSEELTPIRGDPRALLLLALAAGATLVHPPTWQWFTSGAVSSYALTPPGWRAIVESVEGRR